ncbi:MAG: hypothetical protein KF774_11220 [Planctomyces sp.]|nr:hypothetical protein [Planctomyces sp.]
MQRRMFLKRLPGAGASAWMAANAAACGTLLHPERVGQPRGRVDPAVAVLDGLGLLLFFVPGVIAFIVDFSTGAIYLPPEYAGREQPLERGFVRRTIDRRELDREGIERVVAEMSGRAVSLAGNECRTRELESLDEFSAAAAELDRGSAQAPSTG